jgi:ElaB/YqjD/DUF883 family membrane-anchored ribosome-binding protein
MSATDTKSGTTRNTILDTYELAERIEGIRADLRSLISAVNRVAQDRAMDTANEVEQTIRQNPLSSVAIALALGFLFGILTRR